ncbi:MAG: hypothetical protein AVDCRST_MAG68-5124 [uncultured Gemmatimonadetes bacterium]|uniref:RNase H type-1 domain-containing protein n=1 Tax=uncultured Gemmatimonadota bacterium TaxID=203437 RepID=A0A6J4MRE6_9BACT|nr:MAG: hypothetical protein AVDCRST_MAG68-5124 [uncultured Gemmatimonadota bacterium]
MSVRIRSEREPGALRVLATDGSVRGRAIGSAWLSDVGAWGLVIRQHPSYLSIKHGALHAELLAVSLVIEQVPGPFHILCDSQSVVEMVTAWRKGVMKPIPECNSGTLEKLPVAVSRRVEALTIGWVRGHDRHPLNEGADAIARLGSRSMADGMKRLEVRRRAEGLAVAFAREFQEAS